MRKEDYLQKLEQLLYNIPAEDRYEAIQFYSDYLEDAGAEVDEVIRCLGTPEELAMSIQRDLYGDNEAGDYTRVNRELPGTYRAPFSTGGRFTGGYYSDDQSAGNTSYNTDKTATVTRRGKLTVGQWVIFILLCLCAAPVIVPICIALISVVLVLVIAVVAIVFAAGVSGIALVVAAIVVIVAAIVKLIVSPLTSLIMVGGGLLMIGIGLIGIAFTVWMVCKVLPKMFTWFVGLCSGFIHKN